MQEPNPFKIELENWRKQRSVLRFYTLVIIFLGIFLLAGTVGIIMLVKSKPAPTTTAELINTPQINSSQHQTITQSSSGKFSIFVNSSNGINLRSQPSASANILIVVPYSAEIIADQEQGNWYRGSYNGKTGYVMKQYVVKSKGELTPPSS